MKKAKYWIHKAMESNSSEASTIWDKYQLWRYQKIARQLKLMDGNG